MNATHPLNWITEIETSLIQLDQKPQFGVPAPLDWEQLETDINKALNREDCKLTHQFKGWIAPNQILAGFGGKLLSLGIDWSPLNSPAFFITNLQNLKDLMTELFGSEEAGNFFYESAYVQSFYHYFSANMLRVLEKQRFASPLIPRLGSQIEDIHQLLGDVSCFAIDIHLSVGSKNLWGRVLLSENFRNSWKSYFAHLGPPQLSAEMKDKLNIEICLEVAHSRLKQEEWEKIKSGDFIILDHCSYDPQEHKGAVVLTLNQKPVFRGRLKEGGIKLTNYPIYEEASDSMEEDPFNEKFDSEDEDDDLYSDFDEDEDPEVVDNDDDIFAGLEPRKKQPNTTETEKKTPSVSSIKAQLAPQEAIPTISATELPVHLTVEVGRVHMTASTLMSLSPGNLLELNVSPEQGVDLVVNGKKVGRGELIRMGDILGVRILSI